MSTYNTLLSIFSIATVLYCGSLIVDKHKLEKNIDEQKLVIVELKDKIVGQETEIKILAEDNSQKQIAINALEEKIQVASTASQEAIDRLIELSRIKPTQIMPAGGPHEETPSSDSQESFEPKPVDSKPAAEKEKKKTARVIDATANKKFINLRNDIYSRYQ